MDVTVRLGFAVNYVIEGWLRLPPGWTQLGQHSWLYKPHDVGVVVSMEQRPYSIDELMELTAAEWERRGVRL